MFGRDVAHDVAHDAGEASNASSSPKRLTRYQRQRRASTRLADPLAIAAARVSHLLAMRKPAAKELTPQSQVKPIDEGLYVARWRGM